MPTYRADVTDQEQSKLEEATFEGGIPVFEAGKTRVVAKGADGATQRTANAGTNIGSNAGVIMPASDTPNRFVEETQGKA